MRDGRLNNKDRAQWIDNDEGLYSFWQSTRLSKTRFIKDYREEIDEAILNILRGTRRPHYLIYG